MKHLLALATAAVVVASASVAFTQQSAPGVDDTLAQARLYAFQLRAGRYDLARPSVKLLEAAVQAQPGDVRLWNALGTAYFQQVTASFHSGTFAEIPGLVVKARDAHQRALQIAPEDPEALSGHGTALAIMAGFTRQPDLGLEGVKQMNRAAALAPDSTLVRLQRGFTNLGVSAELRDGAAAEADLKHLIRISDGSRPGDVLHVLLGDLYAETGRRDLASAEYANAARPGSTTRDLATGRQAALGEGAPDLKDFARLRGDLGRQCVMCHAP